MVRERSNSGSHWSGFAIFRPAVLTFYKSCPFFDFPEIEGDNSKENGQISLGPKNAEA